MTLRRREVVAGLPLALLASRAGAFGWRNFSEATVADVARKRAAKPYAPPSEALPENLAQLSYDAYRGVRFRPERAVWADLGVNFRLQMFHRGGYFKRGVDLFEVADGRAIPIAYSRDLFRFDSGDPGPLPPDLGFAGFRVHTPINRPDVFDELVVFLGASYFRAVHRGGVYGLSARGLAVGSGQPNEEFPDFRAFWIERPAPGAQALTIHALLDSPSVAGAYRFIVTPGDPTRVAVTARLYPRTPLAEAGIAPLTSMYLFGPEQPRRYDDFRPQVHDSDGLLTAVEGQAGEPPGEPTREWRPLANPASVRLTDVADGQGGFGLLQRQRDFAAYEDLEARYDLRPSAWVTPRTGFDAGAVRLVELPGKDETGDNVGAFWRPASPLAPGAEHLFAYDLDWGLEPAPPLALAKADSGRSGAGRQPGSRRFVVGFTGAADQLAGATPEVRATSGAIHDVVLQPGEADGVVRLNFQFQPGAAELSELRAVLRAQGRIVSESWVYRWQA